MSDGQIWTVLGVERFGAKRGTAGVAGESVGILVSDGHEPLPGDEIERLPPASP